VVRVYLKSEPSGEIGFGILSPEDVVLIKKLYKNPDFKDSKFIDAYHNYFQESVHGIFTDLDDRIYGEKPDYKRVASIGLPTVEKSATFADGWYLLASSFSKCSIDLAFEPSDGAFDSKKLVLEYKYLDFGDFEDELYGPLSFKVISDYKYNGTSLLQDGEHELVDRGFDTEIRIFYVVGGLIQPFYNNRNYSKEAWGAFSLVN